MLSAYIPCGAAASTANGIGICAPNCDYENSKPQVILTVDYSRAALTAVLYVEQAGLFEEFRVTHDVELGHDKLSQDGRRHWEGVKAALEKAIAIPDPGVDPSFPRSISQLVLIGDRVTDDRLVDILKEVLESKLVAGAQVKSGVEKSEEEGIVDPVFAAAMGVSIRAKKRMDETSGMKCEPAGYCK